MKKILLCAATALACAACANKDGYTIEGRIEGLEGKVYLLDEEHNAIDSAVVKSGKFRFSGHRLFINQDFFTGFCIHQRTDDLILLALL